MSNESDEVRFERLLKSVSPTTVRVDPVAAAFAAGRGSTRRQLRTWQSLAAIAMCLGISGVFLNIERHSPVAPAPAMIASAQAPSPGPRSAQSLIMLQQSVREAGVDGLPVSYVPASSSVRSLDSL